MTFVSIEAHLPALLPAFKGIEVLLEDLGILLGANGAVEGGIVREQAYCRLNFAANIVDVGEE